MKILQVNAVNTWGSTGRNCAEIAEYLKTKQDSCITAFSVGPKTENSYRISRDVECKWHGLLSRVFGLQGYFSFFSTQRLKKLIEQYQPDIVHLNNMHANYVNLKSLLLYLGKKDIPVVITLHDCWLFTGKCTHYDRLGCRKWMSGCGKCPQLKADHKSWFFDFTSKMWSDKYKAFHAIQTLAVIGVSDWITDEAKKSPFFSHAAFHERIYNWVNLETFQYRNSSLKEQYQISDKKIILGVASAWNEKKGLRVFCELAKQLGNDYVILLVGKIPQPIPIKNVLAVGSIADEKTLSEYYSIADVMLQLSVQESFGKVVAEALACGTPVLTNTKTANPELVDEGCGIVLDDIDEKSVERACKEILRKGRAHYSANCIHRAKQLFSQDICLEQYRKLYQSLLKTVADGNEMTENQE